jgi:hypothetical protein
MQRFCSENEGMSHLVDLEVDGSILLKFILRMKMGGCKLNYSGLRQGTVIGSCEHGNEPSGFIDFNEFLTTWKSLTFQDSSTHSLSCLSIKMKSGWLGRYSN